MARRGDADHDAGDRGPFPLARGFRLRAPAEFHDAAADVEPRQLHRLARLGLPLAGDQGGSARRRDLSGLCRRRASDRRERQRDRRRDRRHGRDKIGRGGAELPARHGASRQIRASRGRRARLALQRGGPPLRPERRARAAEIRHRAERALGGRSGETSAGPRAALVRLAARIRRPAAAPSSITSARTSCRSGSWCI